MSIESAERTLLRAAHPLRGHYWRQMEAHDARRAATLDELVHNGRLCLIALDKARARREQNARVRNG